MKNLKGACLFGQSGGPTSVINASAAGVFLEALDQENITAVYGAEHGIRGILEEKLNRSIDLVNIEELPKNIQLQIVSRNKKIIFKENENTDRYLYELDTWYKEDYPFWLKLQREMGYEVQ